MAMSWPLEAYYSQQFGKNWSKSQNTKQDKCIHTITIGDLTSSLFSLKGSACEYMARWQQVVLQLRNLAVS